MPDEHSLALREADRARSDFAAIEGDLLHGLRYTFATRAIELGLDWQSIESIVGHDTAEMAQKCMHCARVRGAISPLVRT
jgi:integrase